MIVFLTGNTPSPNYISVMRKNEKPELLIQADLVTQAHLVAAGIHPTIAGPIPELAELYSSLNGVRLRPRQAIEQKAAGMRAGIPDLHLPVGRNGYLSFFVEMKAPGGTTSKVQKDVHAALRRQGNRVEVYYSANDALVALMVYCLGVPTYAHRSI